MTGAIGAMVGGYGTAPTTASVNISNQAIFKSDAYDTATAGYVLSSDGTVRDQDNNILESWLFGGGTASNYEVYASVSSGTLTSGTTGSWLSLGSTQSWAVANSLFNNSVKTAVISLSIRLASTGVVQDTATITLSAESDNFR